MQSRKTGAAFAARRNQFFPAAPEQEEADCREKKEGLIGKSTLYALASAACQFTFRRICTAVEL